MKQNSWKKSIQMGIIAGAVSCALYVLIVCLGGALTGWQQFFQSDMTVKTYGALRWETVAAGGVVCTSLVPVFTLRYEKVRYLFLYLLISILFMLWLYGVVLAVWFMAASELPCPFLSVDALYDLAVVLPIGSGIGTLVAIVFHCFNRD